MDGWNIAQTGGASLLERRIRRRGWHFIRIAEESRQSGVGDSSQEAVACALKLAVRGFSEYFNVVEVRHIHLTRYPWFVIARLGVCPYRIQQSLVQFVPDNALPLPYRPKEATAGQCLVAVPAVRPRNGDAQRNAVSIQD